MATLIYEPIDHDMLTESIRRPDCGAVVTFLGTVRDLTGDQITLALEYEAHMPMAERKMAEIEADVRERWPNAEVVLVHRLGRLEVGEVSVAVAVSSPHRAEAFTACRHAIDRLKEIVPIWKKDIGPTGETEWIHPGAGSREIMTGRRSLNLTNDRDFASKGAARPSDQLVDTFGRVHDNLRVSVTDRCNLRCTYCMPEDVTFLPKDELLTFEEIAHFVRVAVGLGVTKVRLTGGEPLLRRDLHVLVGMLVPIPGLADIGLTTNGLLLRSQARALFEAGLRRLNVSLDTLDPDRFLALSRRDGLDQVLAGLSAARDVGFRSIKVNAIAIRGSTEEDILPLAEYARENGFDLRFIEYMPIGAEPWERDKVLFASEILERLEAEFGPLAPAAGYDPHAPAMEFSYADGRGTVGMIASVSRPFCRQCNRLRLTAEGKVRNCLFALDEADVKPLLRSESGDEEIAKVIRDTVWDKWEGHEINTARFVKPARTMHAIGG